ncbi:MAG: class I SAM-dependent methyltransferase [Streptosporangiaceae bacterium]|nr:class I SAM-dependent methyltransferase [Streptosporangiaceae bacterium]
MGTGPGAITNDGCAVDFYALLPAFGEPEIVHAAVPAAASILELGCGTGRILRPLAALGHPVLGVDDSADMLARVPDLPVMASAIETLRLDRTFDVVLLASTMINSDPATRRAFLATVRHHLDGDGVAVFQQSPPEWFKASAEAGLVTRHACASKSSTRPPTTSGPMPGRHIRSPARNSPATWPRPASGSATG